MPTGHIEKRKGSKYCRIVIELDKNADGQRNRIYRPTKFTRKKDAEPELRRILSEMERGIYIEPSEMSVAEYLNWWLEQHTKSKNLAPKTANSYRFIIDKYLIPALGKIKLTKLQPMQIQNYIIKANDHLSPRTVSYSLTVLREALKHAVRKWRIIPLNPADAVEAPSYHRVKFRALSGDEMQRLLDTAEGHRDYTLIYMALFTGMRKGELLALRWQDVDLSLGIARVTRSLQRITGKGYIIKEPKTEAGIRNVDLPESLVSLLKKLKKEQAQNKLFLGQDYEENDLIFCLENGKPLDPDNVSHRFRRLADKAGFADLRFHDLRHTHASLCLANGEELHVVQQRLGHEKPSTTADIYGHALPGQQKAAADRFDQRFGRH